MSVGLRNSTIETFRKRTHGDQVLVLYGLRPDGDTLSELFTLTKGFLIGRNSDTTEGAAPHILTVDTIYTANLTTADLDRSAYVALRNPRTGAEQRYATTTDTPPLVDDFRYVIGLHPRFNDAKEVVP